MCDGDRDCFDNSDEQPPHCCQSPYHTQLPICISSFLFTVRPTKSPCDLTNEFNCRASGSFPHCIPKHWICDDEIDCDSGIDEDDDVCNPPGTVMDMHGDG